MTTHNTTMNQDQRTDGRLEKVKTVTIDFETFKKVLRRNYLGDKVGHSRSFVLRLYPPFEAEMEAEYYESEQGRHYDSEWDEKPFHIAPEWIILKNTERGFREIIDWSTEATVHDALSEEEIEEEGGINEAVQVGRDMFWDELKTILPDEIELTQDPIVQSYTVDVEWEFGDKYDETPDCPYCGDRRTEHDHDVDGDDIAVDEGTPVYKCNGCMSHFPAEDQ